MIFVNEGYENYKYMVEAYDNYIILSNDSYVNGSWEDPDTIDVIYQYIKPSTLTIESEMSFTSTRDFTKVDLSTNYWDRGDTCEILTATFIIIFFLLFIINGLTRFVKKGGVFFGS